MVCFPIAIWRGRPLPCVALSLSLPLMHATLQDTQTEPVNSVLDCTQFASRCVLRLRLRPPPCVHQGVMIQPPLVSSSATSAPFYPGSFRRLMRHIAAARAEWILVLLLFAVFPTAAVTARSSSEGCAVMAARSL